MGLDLEIGIKLAFDGFNGIKRQANFFKGAWSCSKAKC